MNIAFNLLKYYFNKDGMIEILFINNHEGNALFFNGGGFEYINIHNKNKYDFWQKFDYQGIITDIKETEDFFIIIQLLNECFIRISFLPDDDYANGVVQTFVVYDKSFQFYADVLADFDSPMLILLLQNLSYHKFNKRNSNTYFL